MVPTINDLRAIVNEALDVPLLSAHRFSVGLCHYVYDAILLDGRKIVLRLTNEENRHYFVGAVHWSRVLRSIGIPLPKIYYVELKPRRGPYP